MMQYYSYCEQQLCYINISMMPRHYSRSYLHRKAHLTCPKGLKLGILLVITSEICFFSAFFWTLIHRRLTPSIETGCIWPPSGVITISPLIKHNNSIIIRVYCNMVTPLSKKRLKTTITLGTYFTFLQASEYAESSFTIADSLWINLLRCHRIPWHSCSHCNIISTT